MHASGRCRVLDRLAMQGGAQGNSHTISCKPALLTVVQQLLHSRNLGAAGAALGSAARRRAGRQAVLPVSNQAQADRALARSQAKSTCCSHVNSTHLYFASMRGSSSLSVMRPRAVSCTTHRCTAIKPRAR